MKQCGLRIIAALAFLAFCAGAYAASDVANEMRTLLEQGRSAEAYELGHRHPDQLGEPFFDIYYGIAATNTGRAGEAVLALERYVANMPDDPSGRLELGRAYFVLGEDARAREEFRLVLEVNPPDDVRASVERFLDALRSRESIYRAAGGYALEAGFGFDTNVNAGVAAGTQFVIFGAELPVAAAARKRSDWFSHFAASFNRSVPVRPGLIVFGSAGVELRKHSEASDFDQANVRLEGGLTYIRGRDVLRGSFAFNHLTLDERDFRQVWSLTGEWHHQLDELQGVNAFVQGSQIYYSGANGLRDSTFPVIGVGYRRSFIAAMQPLLNATAFAGKEDVDSSVRSDLSRDILGFRVTGSITPAPRWSVLLGGTWQESDYRSPDLTRGLAFTRRDTFSVADWTVAYAIDKRLSVRLEGLWSSNDSNDALFQYNRNVFAVRLRYEER